MPAVEIYVTSFCPYCFRAKALLKKKGVSYQVINVSEDETLRKEMIERSGGRRTVPQIFIGGKHIGGSDDLYALNKKGELDTMLERCDE